MGAYPKLEALMAWLRRDGRSVKWLAHKVGYSYQQTSAKLHGHSPLTDTFVVRCFSRIPELPGDIFAAHGYVVDGRDVLKRIPLEAKVGGH